MHSFKRFILLFAIFIIIGLGLRFVLEPPTFKHYLDMDMRKMEKKGVYPDMVFFGNSRIMTCFDPDVFVENMEDVDFAFNAGTGSQGIAGSYYYLKDILKRYDIRYVALGVDYQEFLYGERPLKRELLVLERIHSPLIMAEYVINEFKLDEYPYAFRIINYKDYFFSIFSNLREKLSKDYWRGIPQKGDMEYQDLGFVKENLVLGDRAGIYELEAFSEDNVDPSRLEYLYKIIELCKEEDVSLFLCSTPLTQSTVYVSEGYAEGNELIRRVAEENDIYFDDLNLAIDRSELFPDTLMNGMEHVGSELANRASKLYSQILTDHIKGKDSSEYLYPSFELMKENMPQVVAVDIFTKDLGEGEGRKIYTDVIKRYDAELQYKFEINAEAIMHVIQDYSDQDECILKEELIQYPFKIVVSIKDSLGQVIKRSIYIDEDTWED